MYGNDYDIYEREHLNQFYTPSLYGKDNINLAILNDDEMSSSRSLIDSVSFRKDLRHIDV